MESSYSKYLEGKNLNKVFRLAVVLFFSFIPTSIFVFILVYLSSTFKSESSHPEELRISLFVAVIFLISNFSHEIGHFLSGKYIGLKVTRIRYSLLYSVVQLGFENKNCKKLGKVIVVTSGILANLVLALLSLLLREYVEISSNFRTMFDISIYTNVALVIVNLLPISFGGIALDGKNLIKTLK